jgi:F-type H+-transporting ATPase subunit delta
MMRATKSARRSARHLFLRCLVEGRPDAARVRLVARRIAESKRRDGLVLLSNFRRLVRLDRDRHSAVVESATSLADDEREGIQTGLARVYGSGLDASFKENPRLIGGVRIRVGGDLYDGSVRGRLAAFEERL